jgi:tetratricopeptide (TPR) repeat protein
VKEGMSEGLKSTYITIHMPGPSKEDLENYWKNSRPYFDEIAKFYFESDRQYYDEFIAPFYNNPFRRSGVQSSGGGAKIAVFAVMILVLGAAIGVFLLVNEQSDNDKKVNKEETQRTYQKQADATDSVSVKDANEYYEKGISYFNNEDYDNAEKYFKLVPRKDKNYPDAVRKLKKIAEMKIEKENKDERRVKSKPLQRLN